MDYQGQQLSERMYQSITIIFGFFSWIAGFWYSDFSITFYGWFCGLVLSLLLCIPNWPMFRTKPVKWLSEIPVRTNEGVKRKSLKKK